MCKLLDKFILVRQTIRDTRKWTSPFIAKVIDSSHAGYLKILPIEFPEFPIWVDIGNIDIMEIVEGDLNAIWE